MTREKIIRKYLGNPEMQYNENCRDEMRADLDELLNNHLSKKIAYIIETIKRKYPTSTKNIIDRAKKGAYVDVVILLRKFQMNK